MDILFFFRNPKYLFLIYPSATSGPDLKITSMNTVMTISINQGELLSKNCLWGLELRFNGGIFVGLCFINISFTVMCFMASVPYLIKAELQADIQNTNFCSFVFIITHLNIYF